MLVGYIPYGIKALWTQQPCKLQRRKTLKVSVCDCGKHTSPPPLNFAFNKERILGFLLGAHLVRPRGLTSVSKRLSSCRLSLPLTLLPAFKAVNNLFPRKKHKPKKLNRLSVLQVQVFLLQFGWMIENKIVMSRFVSLSFYLCVFFLFCFLYFHTYHLSCLVFELEPEGCSVGCLVKSVWVFHIQTKHRNQKWLKTFMANLDWELMFLRTMNSKTKFVCLKKIIDFFFSFWKSGNSAFSLLPPDTNGWAGRRRHWCARHLRALPFRSDSGDGRQWWTYSWKWQNISIGHKL